MGEDICKCMLALQEGAGGVDLVEDQTICKLCKLPTKKIRSCGCNVFNNFEAVENLYFDELCKKCGLPDFISVNKFEKSRFPENKGIFRSESELAQEKLVAEKESEKRLKLEKEREQSLERDRKIAQLVAARTELMSEYEAESKKLPVETRMQIALLQEIRDLLAASVSQNSDISKNSSFTASKLPLLAAGILSLGMDN